jgi:hypothetical protein
MSNRNNKWAAWQNVGKEVVVVEQPKVKPTVKPSVAETPVVEPQKRIEMPLETAPVVPKMDSEVKPIKKLIKKEEEPINP